MWPINENSGENQPLVSVVSAVSAVSAVSQHVVALCDASIIKDTFKDGLEEFILDHGLDRNSEYDPKHVVWDYLLMVTDSAPVPVPVPDPEYRERDYELFQDFLVPLGVIGVRPSNDNDPNKYALFDLLVLHGVMDPARLISKTVQSENAFLSRKGLLKIYFLVQSISMTAFSSVVWVNWAKRFSCAVGELQPAMLDMMQPLIPCGNTSVPDVKQLSAVCTSFTGFPFPVAGNVFEGCDNRTGLPSSSDIASQGFNYLYDNTAFIRLLIAINALPIIAIMINPIWSRIAGINNKYSDYPYGAMLFSLVGFLCCVISDLFILGFCFVNGGVSLSQNMLFSPQALAKAVWCDNIQHAFYYDQNASVAYVKDLVNPAQYSCGPLFELRDDQLMLAVVVLTQALNAMGVALTLYVMCYAGDQRTLSCGQRTRKDVTPVDALFKVVDVKRAHVDHSKVDEFSRTRKAMLERFARLIL